MRSARRWNNTTDEWTNGGRVSRGSPGPGGALDGMNYANDKEMISTLHAHGIECWILTFSQFNRKEYNKYIDCLFNGEPFPLSVLYVYIMPCLVTITNIPLTSSLPNSGLDLWFLWAEPMLWCTCFEPCHHRLGAAGCSHGCSWVGRSSTPETELHPNPTWSLWLPLVSGSAGSVGGWVGDDVCVCVCVCVSLSVCLSVRK